MMKKYNSSGNPRGLGVAKNGRSKVDLYASAAHSILETDAYLGLDTNGRTLFWQCAKIFFPARNARIFMSLADIAAMMGVFNERTASKAMKQLIAHGFIEEVQPSSFEFKANPQAKSRAPVFRATWLATADYRNRKNAGPTNEFRAWRAQPGSPEAIRVERGREQIARWRNQRIADDIYTGVPTIAGPDDAATSAHNTSLKPENVAIVTFVTPAHNTHHTVTRGTTDKRATSSQSSRVRRACLAWLAEPSATQKDLTARALALGGKIDGGKFSRWLRDASGRKSVTLAQLTALEAAIADQPSEQTRPALKIRAART